MTLNRTEKTAVGYRKVHFFALTKTAVNRKWTCLSALFDLISYISIVYLIDFVVFNYNLNWLVHLVIYYFHPFFNCYYARR
uniref:Uncharacterized protein n=1 Tax=Klebsiella pneumoniae TaxID=573 RepID=A0A483MXI5_KLEPN